MSKFAGPHNVPNKGKIPRVLHLFWMSQRAYHGDKVVMMVFTENVPDGSAVELRISPAGKKDVIDTITGLKMVYEPKYLRFFQARFERLG